MPRATSSESGIHSVSMDCSQASRDDIIGLVARLRSNLQHFRGEPLATFLWEKKVQGFGNIEGRVPVLLLEAAWPRVRRKIRRCCLTGGASQRPSHRPWLGRVLFGYFFPHFERCLAPHGTLECACH